MLTWRPLIQLLSELVLVMRLSQVSSAVRHCKSDDNCNRTIGEQCYRLYYGCDLGQCMCDPKLQLATSSGLGYCSYRLRNGRQRCSVANGDLCRPGMQCRDSVCQCTSGRMTLDGQHCLLPDERLLGDRCSFNDVCLHYSRNGYTRSDVNCSSKSGACECSDGYKRDGISCIRWNIEESGCQRNFQCSGGALCTNGQCLCPSAYKISASGTKCARIGAIRDLPLGAVCDEINETKYCGHNLICHRCPNADNYRCVRFAMESEFFALRSTSWTFPTSRCTPPIFALFSVVISLFNVDLLYKPAR